MKLFMIINTFDKVYYSRSYSAWVDIDGPQEVPVLFATREEADKFVISQKYYLEEKDDRWVMAKVVEVEVNL